MKERLGRFLRVLVMVAMVLNMVPTAALAEVAEAQNADVVNADILLEENGAIVDDDIDTQTPDPVVDGTEEVDVSNDNDGPASSDDVLAIPDEKHETASYTGPTITSQPGDAAVPAGGTLSLSVEAEGEGLAYLWQFHYAGRTSWNSWGEGHELSKRVSAAWDGLVYRCVVTDAYGNRATSEEGTLTVSSGPTITSQPGDAAVPAGGTLSLTVEAEGEGLAYLWQFHYAGRTSWNSWGEGHELSKRVSAAWDGLVYRCVVTDAYGNRATSEEGTLTILPSDCDLITVTSPIEVTLEENASWSGMFVAPKAGTYTFYSIGYPYAYATLWADAEQTDLIDSDNGSNFLITHEMAARDRVYLKVRQNEDEAMSCTVHVSEGLPLELAWFDDRNVWLPKTNEGQSPYVEISYYSSEGRVRLQEGTDYEVAGYQRADGTDLGTVAPSDAGEYIVTYRGIGSYSGTKSIWFAIYDDAQMTQIVPGVDTPFTSAEGGFWVGKFTADADATYQFTLAGADGQDAYGYLYQDAGLADGCEGYGSSANSIVVMLQDGDSVYLKIENNNEGALSGIVTVGVLQIPDGLTQIVPGQAQPVDLVQGEEWCGYFTAEEDGTYVFRSENNNEGSRLQCDLYWDGEFTSGMNSSGPWNPETGNFFVGQKLKAGQTVFVRMTGWYEAESTHFDLVVEMVDCYDLSRAQLLLRPEKHINGVDCFIGSWTASENDLEVCDAARDIVADDAYQLVFYRFDEAMSEYVRITGEPTELGSYAVCAAAVEGSGYENETPWVYFEVIGEHDLRLYDCYLYETEYSLNGNGQLAEIQFEAHDWLNDYQLVAGTDYELVFYDENHVQLDGAPSTAGTFYVRAVGLDPYTGFSDFYEIHVASGFDLSTAELYLDVFYDYNEYDGGTTSWNYTVWDSVGNELSLGTDYVIEFFDAEMNPVDSVTGPGTFYLRAVQADGSNYTGATAYKRLYMADQGANDLAYGHVDFPYGQQFACTGNPIEEVCTVKDYFSNELVLGTDYEVLRYERTDGTDLGPDAPADLGQYYVYYQGKGNYCGQIMAYFSIVDSHDLSSATLLLADGIDTFDYTGDPIQISYTVTDGLGNQLTEGVDYTVTYWNASGDDCGSTPPFAAGSYTMSIDAVEGNENGYYGTLSGTRIHIVDPSQQSGKSIEYAEYSYDSRLFYYDENVGHAPNVTDVTYVDWEDGWLEVRTPLTGGIDYRFARYEDAATGEDLGTEPPIPIGSYVAVYEGLGSYCGELRVSFHIVERPIVHELQAGVSQSYVTGDDNTWVGRIDAPGTGTVVVDAGCPGGDVTVILYEDAGLTSELVSNNTFEGVPFCMTCGLSGQNELYVVVRASSGGYEGEVKVRFLDSTEGHDISSDDFTLTLPTTVFTSDELGEKLAELTLQGPETTLAPETDYVVCGYLKPGMEGNSYSNTAPTTSGKYNLMLAGAGDFYGIRYVPFAIVVDLEPGVAEHVTGDYGESWIGRYVATKSGEHTFLAAGCEDMTSLFLYDNPSLSSPLVWGEAMWDDETDWQNITIKRTLRAGDVIYLVRSGDNQIDCDVTVTEPEIDQPVKRSVADADWSYDADTFVRDWQGHAPTVSSVSFTEQDGSVTTLVEGVDYELVWYQSAADESYVGAEPPTGSGSYVAIYLGIGDYQGVKRIDFSIVKPPAQELESDVPVDYRSEDDDVWVGRIDVDGPAMVVLDVTSDGYWFQPGLYADENLTTELASHVMTVQEPVCVTWEATEQCEVYVAVRGIGLSRGTVNVRVLDLATATDISTSGSCTVSLPTPTFTSSELEDKLGELALLGSDGELGPGADYEVRCYIRDEDGFSTYYYDELPTESGDYDVLLVGIGDCYGHRLVRFHIADSLEEGIVLHAQSTYMGFWYGRFQAGAAGEYTFTVNGEGVHAALYGAPQLGSENRLTTASGSYDPETETQGVTFTWELEAGQVVYLAVRSEYGELENDVTVTGPGETPVDEREFSVEIPESDLFGRVGDEVTFEAEAYLDLVPIDNPDAQGVTFQWYELVFDEGVNDWIEVEIEDETSSTLTVQIGSVDTLEGNPEQDYLVRAQYQEQESEALCVAYVLGFTTDLQPAMNVWETVSGIDLEAHVNYEDLGTYAWYEVDESGEMTPTGEEGPSVTLPIPAGVTDIRYCCIFTPSFGGQEFASQVITVHVDPLPVEGPVSMGFNDPKPVNIDAGYWVGTFSPDELEAFAFRIESEEECYAVLYDNPEMTGNPINFGSGDEMDDAYVIWSASGTPGPVWLKLSNVNPALPLHGTVTVEYDAGVYVL